MVTWDNNKDDDDDKNCDKQVTDMHLTMMMMICRSDGNICSRGKEVESSPDETAPGVHQDNGQPQPGATEVH